MADAKTLLAGDVIRVTFSVMNLKNDRRKREKNNKKVNKKGVKFARFWLQIEVQLHSRKMNAPL